MRLYGKQHSYVIKVVGAKQIKAFLSWLIISIATSISCNNHSLQRLDQLILSKSTSSIDKEKHRTQIIPLLKNIEFESQPKIEFDTPEAVIGKKYGMGNSSIIRTDDGYYVICRLFHNEVAPIMKHKSFLLEYDRVFNLLSQQQIFIPAKLSDNILSKEMNNPIFYFLRLLNMPASLGQNC